MVSDNELLDEVRAVLHAEVADVTAPPALLASVRRRRARRRAAQRWAWIAAPLTAAGLVAAVVMVPAADPSPRGGEPVNVAHVLERTRAALDGVGGHVIYERAVSAAGEKYFSPGEHGLSERWHAPDGSAFRYRASVNRVPRVDLSRNARAETFVDYRNRTYRTRPGDPPNPSQFDDVWTPEEIQKAITDGRGTVLGPGGPIHGIPTVRLTVEAEGKATVPTELWVDAKTYLPVRWRWLQEGLSSVFDVKFLPPTPKNLDKLTAPIPPGFTEVG